MRVKDRIANGRGLGNENDLSRAILLAGDLRRNFPAIRPDHANGLRGSILEMHSGFHHVLTFDVKRVVDDDRRALRLRVHCRGNCVGCAGKHTSKLIHSNYIVVPRELKRFGSRRAGEDVMKLSAHDQRPRIVETLQWIWTSA